MKNIILGLIGVLITMYTLLIGLSILSFYTQKNALEKQVSRIVKNTLEIEFQNKDTVYVEQMLLQELNECVSGENARLQVEIRAMDLEKGILSVRVSKRVVMLNGKEREIVVEKTAIVERVYMGNRSANTVVCCKRTRAGSGEYL